MPRCRGAISAIPSAWFSILARPPPSSEWKRDHWSRPIEGAVAPFYVARGSKAAFDRVVPVAVSDVVGIEHASARQKRCGILDVAVLIRNWGKNSPRFVGEFATPPGVD